MRSSATCGCPGTAVRAARASRAAIHAAQVRPGESVAVFGVGGVGMLAMLGALGRDPAINYVDMPLSIRSQYQYFTEADMSKLRSIGYTKPFATLEEGVSDYVGHYLLKDAVW